MEARGFTSSAPHPALPALPALSCSVAKSLGAKTVAARALACTQELEIISEVVEDVQAVSAVQQFLGEGALPPFPRLRDL